MPLENNDHQKIALKLQRELIIWPDTFDITELARAASPMLFKKAVELALQSNDPRLVRDVSVIASDRAYGKPHQSTSIEKNSIINIISTIPAPPNSVKIINL